MPAEAWAVPITVGERTNPSDRVARGSGTQDPISRGHMAGQANRIDDTTLIRQAQQGNRAAFEELVRHYDQAVLRLALHLTGSEADAQDIFQDAFLKAYKNVVNFRFECSFYTWIYRIVTNLCLDHLRKRQVRRSRRIRKARNTACSIGCRMDGRRRIRSETLWRGNWGNASIMRWTG